MKDLPLRQFPLTLHDRRGFFERHEIVVFLQLAQGLEKFFALDVKGNSQVRLPAGERGGNAVSGGICEVNAVELQIEYYIKLNSFLGRKSDR